MPGKLSKVSLEVCCHLNSNDLDFARRNIFAPKFASLNYRSFSKSDLFSLDSKLASLADLGGKFIRVSQGNSTIWLIFDNSYSGVLGSFWQTRNLADLEYGDYYNRDLDDLVGSDPFLFFVDFDCDGINIYVVSYYHMSREVRNFEMRRIIRDRPIKSANFVLAY